MMTENNKKLTKSEKKIDDFIENSSEEFLFMTIGEMAGILEVSEATISRYARHMGYRDFKEMKAEVLKKHAGKGAARKLAGTLVKTQGFDMDGWLRQQQECLERTREGLDREEFEKGKDAIKNARHIYIHGKNASAAMAELLFFRLRRLGIPVFLIPSGGSEVLEGLVHATKEDVVILFSFSKLSEEGRMILAYEKEAGYRTVAFTGRAYVPPEERADINLYVYRGEEDEYHSMTSVAAVEEALVITLTEEMGSQSAERLVRLQKLKKDYKEKKVR